MESSYVYKSSQEIAQELKDVFDANNEMDEQTGEEWPHPPKPQSMRTFSTGATRNIDIGKFDFEGFFSPLVLERRAEYMHKHRLQADGNLRDSDNWQKGMGAAVYMKSAWRHFIEWWKSHRQTPSENIEESICALMFNCEGYLHEILQEKQSAKLPNAR